MLTFRLFAFGGALHHQRLLTVQNLKICRQILKSTTPPTDANNVLADSYYWHCRFTFPNDKLECYLTEKNNCKTFKELRRWWRKEKPALKLVSAVRQ